MSFLNFNVGDQTSPNDELNTDFLALLTGGTLNLFSGNQITFNLTDTGLNPNTTYDLLSFVDGGLTTGVLGVTDWILGGTPGGFTSANLIVTDTLIQFQTGLLVTGDWYWNAGGTPSQWGDAANWWDDKSGGATGAVRATTPGQGSDVIFIADNITGGGAITTTPGTAHGIEAGLRELNGGVRHFQGAIRRHPVGVVVQRLQ